MGNISIHGGAAMTPKQQDILDYIRIYISEHGYSPSFDDISADLGMVKSNAYKHVQNLVNIGELEYTFASARSIRIPKEKQYKDFIHAMGLEQEFQDWAA
jgi:SOS-response transcriptional repressor LexA